SEPLAAAVKQAVAQSAAALPLFRALTTTGIGALHPAAFANPTLPSPARETATALLVIDPKVVEAQAAEPGSLFDSLTAVRDAQITTLGDIPLVVISRGVFGGSWRVPGMSAGEEKLWWQEMQADLGALSPQGQSELAEQSGHHVRLDQPQLVIDAI